MLKRENDLRISPETQKLYEAAERSADTDWMEVTGRLQQQVASEFGFKESEQNKMAVDTLRSARAQFAAEDPSILDLAVYLKYNRARRGTISVGDTAPNVPLTYLDGLTKNLSDIVVPGRPLVLIAGSYS